MHNAFPPAFSSQKVDQLLTSSDPLEALKAYVKNFTAAQEYINTLLYEIAAIEDGAARPSQATIDRIHLLLKAGANPNYIHAAKGESILQTAAANGHGTFVQLLIEGGADVLAYVPSKPQSREWLKDYDELDDLEIEKIYQDHAQEEQRMANMTRDEKAAIMREQGRLPLQKAIKRLFWQAQDPDEEFLKARQSLFIETITALSPGRLGLSLVDSVF